MPDNRKPLIYGAFPVCRNYTVRAQLRLPLARQRCAAQTDSGLAGALGFFHHGKHLRPSGLQFETLLGAGDGVRYAASRSGRFRQQVGAKRRKKRGIKPESVLSKIYGKNSPKPGDFRSKRKKKKNPETRMVTGFFDGGAGGIRTHEPVRTT